MGSGSVFPDSNPANSSPCSSCAHLSLMWHSVRCALCARFWVCMYVLLLSLSRAQKPLLKSRHLHQAGGELENYTQGKICTVSDKVHAQLLGKQSHHLSKLGKRHLSKELGLTPRVVSGNRINANAFLINANAASIRETGFFADWALLSSVEARFSSRIRSTKMLIIFKQASLVTALGSAVSQETKLSVEHNSCKERRLSEVLVTAFHKRSQSLACGTPLFSKWASQSDKREPAWGCRSFAKQFCEPHCKNGGESRCSAYWQPLWCQICPIWCKNVSVGSCLCSLERFAKT